MTVPADDRMDFQAGQTPLSSAGDGAQARQAAFAAHYTSLDASRPVDILLESSTNFVDWAQALPGTYGTSSQARYFRVRAVRR